MSSKEDLSLILHSSDDMPPLGMALVANLIRSWALYEHALSAWICSEINSQPDLTRILVGNMDIRNKIDKLIAILKKKGEPEKLEILRVIQKATAKAAETRNSIVHCVYTGHNTDEDGLWLNYVRSKYAGGSSTHLEAFAVNQEAIIDAAKFASATALVIFKNVYPDEQIDEITKGTL